MNLPPLPQSRFSPESGYTAEQMREYGQACVAGLIADAARYRWLKSREGLTLTSSCSEWIRPDGSRYTSTHYLAEGGIQHAPADSLDAAIDAAIAKEAK